MIVRTAVTIHVIRSRPGDCTWRAMSAETMKMPEPIIEPITIVVASISPRPLTSPRLFALLRPASAILQRSFCTSGYRSPTTAIESAPAAHTSGAV